MADRRDGAIGTHIPFMQSFDKNNTRFNRLSLHWILNPSFSTVPHHMFLVSDWLWGSHWSSQRWHLPPAITSKPSDFCIAAVSFQWYHKQKIQIETTENNIVARLKKQIFFIIFVSVVTSKSHKINRLISMNASIFQLIYLIQSPNQILWHNCNEIRWINFGSR